MSAILGFDIDGRPLQAGDQVVVVRALDPRFQGALVRVTGPSMYVEGWVRTDATDDGAVCRIEPKRVRKSNTGQEPAPESFAEIIQNLKTGEKA